MTQVIQCDTCGGRVVYDAGREAVRCLFCGSEALHADEAAEALRPDSMLPFEVDRATVDASYRRWARSSWWYPRPLRALTIELSELQLPVWRFEASLETHWAGLSSAATRSGSKPRAGVEHAQLGTPVPASMGLQEAELLALEPYREGAAVRFDQGVPHEVPALSERAASEQARTLLRAEHRRRIMRSHRLTRCNCSVHMRVNEARLLMVPVYIGSFRYRDRPWRFVVNGQTGKVTGRAPLDRRKIALVVLMVVAAVVAWFVLQGRG